MQTTYIAL